MSDTMINDVSKGNSDIPTLSSYRFVIFMCISLIGFIGGYSQMQIVPLAYKIIPAINLTTSTFSAIALAPMVGGVFLGIYSGALCDRFGPKKVVGIAMFLSVIGITFRFACATFWPFFLLSILVGLGSGLLGGCAAKIFGYWFPQSQMTVVMGGYLLFTMAGQSLAVATTALFPSMSTAFLTAGAVSFLVFLLWVFCLKEKPDDAPEVPSLPVTKYLGKAARSKNVWLASLGLAFLMGANMTVNNFLPNALNITKGVDPVTAGFYGSIFTLSAAFGAILGPIILNRLGIMKPALIVGAIIGAVGAIVILQVPFGAATAIAVFVTGFMVNFCYMPLFSSPVLLPDIGPEYAGSAGGILLTIDVIGAVALPTFVITKIAGANNFLLFALGGACFLLAAVPILLLPELGSKRKTVKTIANGETV